MSETHIRVSGLPFRVSGLPIRVSGLPIRVSGLPIRVSGGAAGRLECDEAQLEAEMATARALADSLKSEVRVADAAAAARPDFSPACDPSRRARSARPGPGRDLPSARTMIRARPRSLSTPRRRQDGRDPSQSEPGSESERARIRVRASPDPRQSEPGSESERARFRMGKGPRPSQRNPSQGGAAGAAAGGEGPRADRSDSDPSQSESIRVGGCRSAGAFSPTTRMRRIASNDSDVSDCLG